jgi:hypothetical protein
MMPLRKRESVPSITLSVPSLCWFQNLLDQTVQDTPESLSTQLTILILEDLKKRNLLNKRELVLAEKREGTTSRPLKPGVRRQFCLYIPQELDFLKDKIKQASYYTQSKYVWDLFIQAHISELTTSECKEWYDFYENNQQGMKPKNVIKV